MKISIKLALLLLISLFVDSIFAQENVSVPLNWKDEPSKILIGSREILYPSLENSYVSDEEFLYMEILKRSNQHSFIEFSLTNYQTESIDDVTKKFIEYFNYKISDKLEFNVHNTSEAGKPVTVLTIVPFIKINGEIRRLTTVNFNQSFKAVGNLKSTYFAANSVLRAGNGDWYKISVKTDGIYKIDYDFLKDIGVDIDNINPQHIHIYGNGFGKLPEENDVYRPDDLIKNAIYIEGENDGSFDQNDYILFYGKGPHRWEWNGTTDAFERVLNIYSDHTAYFININTSDPPLRIGNATQTAQPATHIVTDYNSYSIHEREELNILRTGQRWYGEVFDVHLSQTFPIHIPDLKVNEPAKLRGAFAATHGGPSNSAYFSVQYNGNSLANVSMGMPGSGSITRGSFFYNGTDFRPSTSTFAIHVQYNRSNPSDKGYLDFLEVNSRSFLKYHNKIHFRDVNSVGVGNVAEFNISNFPSNATVWEITEPTNPRLIQGDLVGGTYSFSVNSDSLRSFAAFDANSYARPNFIKKVANQNLHALAQADYLIITHSKFLNQAERLANLHRNNGLSVHVVTTEQVYNEFSGGTQDPTAIKFFAKMFYDRAQGDVDQQPKYMLLFGRGSYDPLNRVENNYNLVVMYETENSESYTSSVVTDDYFGLLDDTESFGATDLLDIAIGRFIAIQEQDAKILVDKVEHYMNNGSDLFAQVGDGCCDKEEDNTTHGDWRNRYMVIADDEESGTFVINDLEPSANYVFANHPEMNAKKIYSDAYTQITTAGGERYPDVNEDISRNIEAGVLVSCFVGHGGPTGATSERIMTIGETQAYRNIDKLMLFMSATCEFARVDDNERVSIGEYMSLNDQGGAIALMTTSRAVFITTNSLITKEFFKYTFKRDSELKPPTFGDIITNTKNNVAVANVNKRSFMLVGDPALRIALPYEKVVLDSINGVHITSGVDTLKALSKVRMKAHIEDQYGNKLSNFNGIIQNTIFDKPTVAATLGQDLTSPVIDFEKQESILFRGKSTVKNGELDFEFIVPKDINYAYGEGKASFYAWSEANKSAGGYSNGFIIGGIDTTGLSDNEGPLVELYLNDDSFVNGGITNETPILIAKLYDESGINTVGNGIGHDITLIIDDKTDKAIVLNDFYESDLDTYKSGEVRYQLSKLKPGLHTLTFKAWDVNNNSSEWRIEFVVQEDRELVLDHVLNYPNPFTTHTEFFFEHNQVCEALQTQIEIYTVTGRLVKTINQLIETQGFRTAGILWDGRDEFGDELARGVYIYRVTVETPDGDKAQEIQKLYLLK
ncbi:MAG: type IX secretion system sortase PorU [Brumimicrobium sp.]